MKEEQPNVVTRLAPTITVGYLLFALAGLVLYAVASTPIHEFGRRYFNYVVASWAGYMFAHTMRVLLDLKVLKLFPLKRQLGIALAGLLGMLVLCLGLISIVIAAENLADWIKRPQPFSWYGSIGAAVAVTLLAGWLFLLRLRMRAVYGLSEALLGLGIAINKLNQEGQSLQPDPSGMFVATLTAGVYLMVRGYDNIHQGIDKTPKDSLWVLLERRLRPPPKA